LEVLVDSEVVPTSTKLVGYPQEMPAPPPRLVGRVIYSSLLLVRIEVTHFMAEHLWISSR